MNERNITELSTKAEELNLALEHARAVFNLLYEKMFCAAAPDLYNYENEYKNLAAASHVVFEKLFDADALMHEVLDIIDEVWSAWKQK